MLTYSPYADVLRSLNGGVEYSLYHGWLFGNRNLQPFFQDYLRYECRRKALDIRLRHFVLSEFASMETLPQHLPDFCIVCLDILSIMPQTEARAPISQTVAVQELLRSWIAAIVAACPIPVYWFGFAE